MEKEHLSRKPKIEETKKIYDEVKEFEDPETYASCSQKELEKRFDEENKKN